MLRPLLLSLTVLTAIATRASHAAAEEPSDASGADRAAVPEPNRWLAAGEIAIILTAGGLEYWNRHDGTWRYRPSTWRDRFSTTEWLILDTSTFATNYSYHTMAATGYHLAARTNGLSVIESAAYSLVASAAWEYVVEYREKIDHNDMIFTTPAGVSMGEFAHLFGRLLHQQGPGTGWDIARWTLGFAESLNDGLNGVDEPRGPDVAHRFRVAAGASRATGLARASGGAREEGTAAAAQLRLGADLAALGGLRAPGSGWRGFRDGNFTSLDVALSLGSEGARETYLLSDTFLAGWRYRDVSRRAARGHSISLGTATAVRYQRERFGAWENRLGVAHLPGLAARGRMWGPGWELRGTARLHPDYGGVDAMSHARWSADHPGEVGRSTIGEQGYYHAFGVSGRLGAALRVSPVTVGGELFAGRYGPHDARDKRHDEVTVEQNVASRFFDYSVWVRSALPGPLFVRARLDGRRRWERFERLDASARMRRFGLEVGTSF